VARALGVVAFNQLCGRCYPIVSCRHFGMDNQLKRPVITVAGSLETPKTKVRGSHLFS